MKKAVLKTFLAFASLVALAFSPTPSLSQQTEIYHLFNYGSMAGLFAFSDRGADYRRGRRYEIIYVSPQYPAGYRSVTFNHDCDGEWPGTIEGFYDWNNQFLQNGGGQGLIHVMEYQSLKNMLENAACRGGARTNTPYEGRAALIREMKLWLDQGARPLGR